MKKEVTIRKLNIKLKALKKKCKKTEERLRKINEFNKSLINTIPFEMDVVDEDGNVMFLSPVLEARLGKEAIGKKCWVLYRDDKKQCNLCPLKKGVKTGETKVFEDGNIFDGKTFQIFHTGMIYKNKKAIMEVFIDITRSGELERLKDEFVSTVSHELRTPLSIAKEGISIVLDKVVGKINKKQEKLLTSASSNIDRLARIINDLLDISKIETGKIRLDKKLIDITGLIKQVVSSFEHSIKNKGLDLKVNLPKDGINMYTDSDKIAQVFTNLIGNSIKFTNKGFIEVSALEREDEVECSVADTGIGISKKNQSSIFKKFQQFERLPGAGGKGTGLGLAIAKAIVEMCGGKIWVESRLGKGTKFIFILPKRRSQ